MHHEYTERIWHLLARKTADEITEQEIKELDNLLQQYPHALYMQELLNQDWHDKYKFFNPEETSLLLEKHKQRLEAVIEDAPSNGKLLSLESITLKSSVKRRKSLGYWVAAAGIVIIVSVGLRWWMKPIEEKAGVAMQRLETQAGSRSEILLPDGTKVRLNAGSSLDYPQQFNGKTRDVQLTGEAYFDVAKDKTKPFLVHTKAFTVKVVGTVFNIRAYADEDSAVASLIQGVVEVQFDNSSDNAIVLKPNEKLTVAMPGVQPADDAPASAKEILKEEKIYGKRGMVTTMKDSTIAETAWTENKLAFKNSSFEKIAGVLEKWYGVDIRFKSEHKKQINLTGTFEGESLEEVLQAFQFTGTDFRFEKDSEGVIWIE